MTPVSNLRARAEDRARRTFDQLPHPVQQAGRLIDRTRRDTIEDRVPGLAAEAALFTLISLPALLLIVLGSLGFVATALGPEGSEELRRLVLEVPESLLSAKTYASYEDIATTAIGQGRGDVISIGVLLSVWTGSRAVTRYLETITIAYDVTPRPSWRRRLLALAITVAGLVGAVAVLPPLVLGPRLVEWVAPDSVAQGTLDVLGFFFWPTVLLLVLVALTTLYHVGVPWRTPWRRDVPGAVLALVLFLVASAGLRAYLAVSTGGDAIYAQLATPIAVVLWLYVTGFAVLLGAELNAEIEKMWPTSLADRSAETR